MKKLAMLVAVMIGLATFAACTCAQTLLQSTEFQITTDSNGHSTPILAQDSIGYYVVYTEYSVVNGVDGNASIYYQRVSNTGQPSGSPVVVANSSMNQYLNDAYGDYIVYTVSPGVGQVGDIALYQISTGMANNLTDTGDNVAPRIYGNYVIWLEELAAGTQIMAYDITSGFPVQAAVFAGPTPSVNDAAIGSRFIVWSQMVNNQLQVAAYDMQQNSSFLASSASGYNEGNVATGGSWITFEVSSTSVTSSFEPVGGIAIQALNESSSDTPTTATVASNGADNQRPNISGDILAYESNVLGNYQIFLYRLAEGDTYQVTASSYDEHLNNLMDKLVVYVDDRTGNDQIYLSAFNFVSGSLVTANPNFLNFGNVNLGNSSTQNFTLYLTGSVTLNSIEASGDFSITSNSCSPLPYSASANSTCTLQIQFSPSKPGQRGFPLVVTDSNSRNYTFALEGTGVGSALALTPGVISTVAGTSQGGYNGDNISASSAELNGPNGLVMDNTGNLYIADSANNRIRVINNQLTPLIVAGVSIAPGNIATVAGNGTQGNSNGSGSATSAELYYPGGVAIDSTGNLYIADTDNFLVRKVDGQGNISTFAGGYPGAGCENPTDNLGDGCPATQAYLSNATGVAVDLSGNVYIADYGDSLIRMVNPSGIISTVAGGGNGCPSESDTLGDGCPATSAQLQNPYSITVDSAGNLYIADTANNRIRKVNTSGIISTVAGGGGTGGGSASGYSGDGGAATGAQLNHPSDVAIDSAGDLYITDTGNAVLRKVDGNGIISTVAGFGNIGAACSFGTYIFGDGCPATNAFLGSPQGLAVDGGGNLFIADYEDSRIREVAVNTAILTFGTVDIGGTSPEQIVSVSDVGNASLNFSAFTISPNFQADNTGSYQYCVTTTALAPGTTCTLGVDFVPSVPGNPVPGRLAVADDALGGSTQTVQLSGVSPSIPVISWPTPAAITYGTTLSGLQLDASANIAGTYTYNPPGGTLLGVGSHTLSLTFVPVDSTDYTEATATVTLVVQPALLNVIAPSVVRQYGQANPALNSVTFNGFVNGDTASSLGGTLVCSSAATPASGVGSYSILCSGLTSGNYNLTFTPGVLTITPAGLTITANNQAKAFDATNPPLTWTASGFVNGDTVSVFTANPVCVTTAGTTSPTGTYPITCSGAAAANYVFTYVAGTLTIGCHYVTIGVSPSTVAQGGLVTVNATVTSCTNTTQTIVEKFVLSGPLLPGTCGNAETVVFTTPPFALPAKTNQKVSFPFPIAKNSCVGNFTITSTTYISATAVDSTSSSLTVVK